MVFEGGIEVAAPAAGLARRAGAARKPHPARLDRDGTTLPSATFREWMTSSAPLLVAGGRPAARGGTGRGATRAARAAAAAATDDAVRARLAPAPLAAGEFGDQLAALLASRTQVAGGGPAPPPKKRRRAAPKADAAPVSPAAGPFAVDGDGGAGVHDYGFGEYGYEGEVAGAGGVDAPPLDGAAASPGVTRLLDATDDGIER